MLLKREVVRLRKEQGEEELSKEEEELWREDQKAGDEVVEGLNELEGVLKTRTKL